MTRKRECKCGHDKESHFKQIRVMRRDDEDVVGVHAALRLSCLARGCECRVYDEKDFSHGR